MNEELDKLKTDHIVELEKKLAVLRLYVDELLESLHWYFDPIDRLRVIVEKGGMPKIVDEKHEKTRERLARIKSTCYCPEENKPHVHMPESAMEKEFRRRLYVLLGSVQTSEQKADRDHWKRQAEELKAFIESKCPHGIKGQLMIYACNDCLAAYDDKPALSSEGESEAGKGVNNADRS